MTHATEQPNNVLRPLPEMEEEEEINREMREGFTGGEMNAPHHGAEKVGEIDAGTGCFTSNVT